MSCILPRLIYNFIKDLVCKNELTALPTRLTSVGEKPGIHTTVPIDPNSLYCKSRKHALPPTTPSETKNNSPKRMIYVQIRCKRIKRKRGGGIQTINPLVLGGWYQ